MRKKISWVLISCLIVAALVLVSCGPAVTEEEEEVVTEEEEEEVVGEEEEEVVEDTGAEMVRNAAGKLVEKPRYGGLFVQSWRAPRFFDDTLGHVASAITMGWTNEALLQGDWAKGSQGTGEATWVGIGFPRLENIAGGLAESWELADPETVIFQIRKGVHFHDKPPTNGRELTADDVVFSLIRLWEAPRSWQSTTLGWESNLVSITAPDKWTVVIKTLPGKMGPIFDIASMNSVIVPPEAVGQYGDLTAWENSVGTGPFTLVDYVDQSSATLVRNPNYWMKDPLHSNNTLPYLDGIKALIIPDASTRLAALRTAKIDWLGGPSGTTGVSWENAEQLVETNPEFQFIRFLPASTSGIFMRVNKPELPYDDIRVRRALAMAIDNQNIADGYYAGNGLLFAYPIVPVPEFIDMFTPLDELPESTRELYEYHPDKARQLLADAGYPDGFEATIPIQAADVDLLSIVKAYWADIGVDITLDVKTFSTWLSIGYGDKYQDMIGGSLVLSLVFQFEGLRVGARGNFSRISDPLIEEAYAKVRAARFDETERRRIWKDIAPYIADQAYVIQLPVVEQYYVWQPWVKGYHGEFAVGSSLQYEGFAKYLWYDQDLKEEMTGRR